MKDTRESLVQEMKNKVLINNIKLDNADFIKELQDKLKQLETLKTLKNGK